MYIKKVNMYISPRPLCYFSGCARDYCLLKKRIYIYAFNITTTQVYAPTSSYADSEVDEFYMELQSLVDQTAKHDILVVQGDWNAKAGEDAPEDWREVCGPFCNPETNDRRLKLLDFATYNSLVLAHPWQP